MSKAPSLPRALHAAGMLLAIAGVVFVVQRALDESVQIDFTRLDASLWLAVALLTAGYGAANGLLALAWWNLLNACALQQTRRWAVQVYGISQIAKYVPGNITHLVGRQALGMAASLPGWVLARTTVYEIGLMAAAGGLFSALLLTLAPFGRSVPESMSLFVAATVTVVGTLWWVLGRQWASALLLQVLFLGVSGLVFALLVGLLGGGVGVFTAVVVVGAYVLAWLAGLLTPGAPAGIGIREAVLLVLLGGIVNEADLLLAVVLGRLVTVGGDFSFFAWSFLDRHGAESVTR